MAEHAGSSSPGCTTEPSNKSRVNVGLRTNSDSKNSFLTNQRHCRSREPGCPMGTEHPEVLPNTAPWEGLFMAPTPDSEILTEERAIFPHTRSVSNIRDNDTIRAVAVCNQKNLIRLVASKPLKTSPKPPAGRTRCMEAV